MKIKCESWQCLAWFQFQEKSVVGFHCNYVCYDFFFLEWRNEIYEGYLWMTFFKDKFFTCKVFLS